MMRIRVDDERLRQVLAGLSTQMNEKVRKQGARRALTPYLKTLRGLWRAAAFRGKPTHRTAISRATRFDIRRKGSGPSAPLAIRMGVQYGKKGGTLAKGRQRVWHLLENGFKHRGGTVVAGRKISTRFATGNIQKIGESIATETLAAAKSVLRL
jgi:hypothetical protein